MGALKKGWKEGFRALIGLYGCFTKGYHTRKILTAIAVDPNNQMLPVAYALVESKYKDTWSVRSNSKLIQAQALHKIQVSNDLVPGIW